MSYSGKLICKNKPDSNNSFDSISNIESHLLHKKNYKRRRTTIVEIWIVTYHNEYDLDVGWDDV